MFSSEGVFEEVCWFCKHTIHSLCSFRIQGGTHWSVCAWAYGCACFLFSFRSWTWHPSLYPVCSGEDQGRASPNLMARQSHQPGWWIILCLAAWLCIITGPARVQHWQCDSPQNTFPSDNSHFSNMLPAYASSCGSPFFSFYLFKWKGGAFPIISMALIHSNQNGYMKTHTYMHS